MASSSLATLWRVRKCAEPWHPLKRRYPSSAIGASPGEISQKVLINQAADRGAYICQSQSLNLFMENANFAKLTSMHFYGWKAGLKTGMYYLRTKAATDAIKFTLDKEAAKAPVAKTEEERRAEITCSLDDPDSCEMCSG